MDRVCYCNLLQGDNPTLELPAASIALLTAGLDDADSRAILQYAQGASSCPAASNLDLPTQGLTASELVIPQVCACTERAVMCGVEPFLPALQRCAGSWGLAWLSMVFFLVCNATVHKMISRCLPMLSSRVMCRLPVLNRTAVLALWRCQAWSLMRHLGPASKLPFFPALPGKTLHRADVLWEDQGRA
jgi:hypothetical protein